MQTRTPWMVVAAIALGTSAASADLVFYAGDTTGEPRWNRPQEHGDFLSVVGTDTPYEVIEFQVGATGLYHFVSNQQFDGVVFIYEDEFDPDDPLENYVDGNDNIFGAPGLSDLNVRLEPGRPYFLVTTGNANHDFGAYEGTIRGFGSIEIIPAPGAAAVLGLAGLVTARTRRRDRRRARGR